MKTTPSSNDAGPIRMSLSSRFENIELAQHLCGKLLEGREVSEETRHWLLMALREALANAIKHGNRQDLSKRIHLEISIRDEGEGFDPAAVEDPLAPENRLKTSGRGIFYMKTFMDDVRFRKADGGGMEIVLTKDLNQGKEKEE